MRCRVSRTRTSRPGSAASSAQRALSTLSILPATAQKVQYTKQELKTLRQQKELRSRSREAKYLVTRPMRRGVLAGAAALGDADSGAAATMFADFAFRGLTHLSKCVMPMNLRAHASELASALHIAYGISPETADQLNENSCSLSASLVLLSTNIVCSTWRTSTIC